MECFPATVGQSAVWFADQSLGHSSAYNVPVRFDVHGPVSTKDVMAAGERLVAGTPAFRVRMGLDPDGAVVQWFSPDPPRVEWLERSQDDQLVERVVDEHLARPFDADGGELVRLLAVRTEVRTILLVICHHVVLDGASQQLVANRFFRCLAANAAQPEGRYRELVERVRRAEEDAAERDTSYWRARIAEGLGQTGWTPRGRPDGRGGRSRAVLSPERRAEFQRLSRRLDVSPFSVVLGAVHQALAGFGMTRSVVCTATSVRPPDGSHDDTIGCFVNQVPLLARHEPGERLDELLVRAAPAWRADLRRRNLPLMTIMNETDRRTGLDHVFTSYRPSQAVLTHRHGAVRVTADIFHRYYDTKTELSIRFMPRGENLEYEVEWSAAAPPGLGADFATALRSYFEGGYR